MARTGLYKSEVKKARDSLISQGKNPSIDALRIALGNTGSKTTIHKYLKELEEEDGSPEGRKIGISEALQDLVARLATQLQEEANVRIEEINTCSVEQARQQAENVAALQKEIDALRLQLQRYELAREEEKTAHATIQKALQQETVLRHTLEQQVTDLKERLAENEAHRHSLEEKHQHAREALEHYRQSVKEQRDQDQRRHEQQIQQLQAEMRQLQQSLVVKQNEVTRLNQEGAVLVADLSHAQKSIYEQQSHHQQLEKKLELLQSIEQRCKLLEAQISEKESVTQERKNQLDDALHQAAEFSKQVHCLELALATSNAKLEAQQSLTTELRAYLERQSSPEDKQSEPQHDPKTPKMPR